MTVGELKEELEKYPDTMEVGGIGHYGECLDLAYVSSYEMFVGLYIEDAGEYPD